MASSTRSSERARRGGGAGRRLAARLSFAVELAATAPALADGARDAAKALTDRAEVEYNVGHFAPALELYGKAYERFASPALLFDIGQCHKMLKDYERALFFFRGYLREQPAAPNRAFVEQLIAESQSALDAQRAADAAQRQRAASHEQASPKAAEGTAPPGGGASTSTSTSTQGLPPGEAPAASGSATLRVAGLVTAGVGVALAFTGVYFGLHAASLSGEISQLSASRGTWSAQYQSDYDAGRSSAHAASALYVVGAAAIVAGGVLAYVGWPRGRAPVTAAVEFAPGGGSLAVAGRF